MENETIYSAKFEMPYISCVNFKEKESIILSNIIKGSRLGELVNFDGYANISFDEEDKNHWHPQIKPIESFTRNKSNSLVFGIKGNNKYNKIFVYQTSLKETRFYGFIFYNTETNKCLHIYNVEYDHTKLIIGMFRIIQNNVM